MLIIAIITAFTYGLPTDNMESVQEKQIITIWIKQFI